MKSQLNTIVVKPSISVGPIGVHFNLWNSDKNNIHCLDVGLMCPIMESKYKIELIVPGRYKSAENLVEFLKKDQIACNIFNESVKVTSVAGKYVLLTKESDGNAFLVFDGEISCSPMDKVQRSVISLDVEKNDSQSSITQMYFRIRICNFDISSISTCDNSLSRFFVPYCEKNTVFDFRLNDSKLLSVTEGRELQKKKITFSKIHFLLIGDVNESIHQNNGPLKIRVFENHNWDDYISNVHSIDNPMIAYHMSKETAESASFLLRIQANKTNALRLLLYTIAVVVLSVVANAIYNLFCFYCFE